MLRFVKPLSFLRATSRSTLIARLFPQRLAVLCTLLLVAAVYIPLSHPVSGQIATPIALIRDINTNLNAASPTSLILVGGRAFFINDSVVGRELWSSDGTTAGTHLVKDIAPGPASSNPNQLTVLGNKIFFTADDGEHGSELWVSDGTESGTYLVQDITLGKESTNIRGMTAVGDNLFFFTGGENSQTLWQYANSALRTVKSDISNELFGTASFNNILYFSIEAELWRSDGTPGGTSRIATLPDLIDQLVPIQHTLFLINRDNSQLWKSDGTEAGTQLFSLPGGATFTAPIRLAPEEKQLFFVTGGAIWQTDGTSENTRLLATKPDLADVDVREVTGVIYFGGRNTQNNSWELWRTDGTPTGTALLKAVASTNWSTTVEGLAAFNGQLVFRGPQGGSSAFSDLWISDGTAQGTRILKQISIIAGPTQLGDQLVFLAQSNTDSDPGELWASDGTEAGTKQISSTQHKTRDSISGRIVQLQGKIYALANDSSLWQSDGTANGTTSVKTFPLIPGEFGDTSSLYTTSLVSTTNRLFFAQALQLAGKAQLWTSDGTSNGTIPLATLEDVPSIPVAESVLNDKLIMIVLTGFSPPTYKLVTSDGTPAGTVNQGVIPNLNNNTSTVFAETPFNGKLFFVTGSTSPALWQTDGTLAGTTQVAPLSGNPISVSSPVVANGRLFFVVSQNNQYELWTSDGTGAGTSLVKVLPATENSNTGAPSIAVLNNTLFFTGDDGVHGRELWRSDGTSAGTHLVADINPGKASSALTDLVNIHGTLLFSADDSVHGSELWASDGTSAGTRMVADIAPGILDSLPGSFTAVDGFVAFAADDGVTGRELRRIDAPVGVQLQLAAPSLVASTPQSTTALPISYGNAGATKAVSVTLTLTLGDGLAYLSDTSGISPTINGNVLTWTLPSTSFLIQRSFQVQIGTPNQPLGTRLPVDLTVRGQDENGTPVEVNARSEVLIARQVYLPIVRQ